MQAFELTTNENAKLECGPMPNVMATQQNIGDFPAKVP